MYYSLEFIDIANTLYVYNEVESKIYKINNKLLQKMNHQNTKNSRDIRSVIRKYMIENGMIKKPVIHDRILDCSEYVDLHVLVLNSINGKNQELANSICVKYHIQDCKICCNEDSSSFEGNVKDSDYSIEDILKILLFEKKCKVTNEMINRLYESWMKIKQDLWNTYMISEVKNNSYINVFFDMIADQQVKYFPCEWGLNRLYIENGILYRCDQSKEKNIQIHEINCISTVDEYAPCKLCNMRYICGGICNAMALKTTKYCDFVHDVFHMLLAIYIMKKPKNIIELT